MKYKPGERALANFRGRPEIVDVIEVCDIEPGYCRVVLYHGVRYHRFLEELTPLPEEGKELYY